jgi:hypothetical protein
MGRQEMKLLALILVLVLSACSTVVPVAQKFPEAPTVLMGKCPDLELLGADETSITDLLKSVVKNYTTYYACSIRLEGWQGWYVNQKQIFDSVK